MGATAGAREACPHSLRPLYAAVSPPPRPRACEQKDEFLRLAINAIHNDLISRNEAFQSLALTFVSNSECSRAAAHAGLAA